MVAVKAGDVDRAVMYRHSDVNLLLFYGPDAGRIAERAKAAAQAAVADPSDPFQLIRMDGDAVAETPTRLVEEATTFGMFGGTRAIWVRPTGRTITPAVTACLDVALIDTLVVIEAGDLAKSSPLRAACEASPRALALPCYSDEGRDLAGVITETLRGYGLSIDGEARDLLAESLGGDRLATRGELEKLALYAHGQASVTVEDIEAVISDVSGPSIDAVIDAAYLGDRAGLEAGLEQLAQHGTSPAAIIALALRHGLTLLGHVARLGGGSDVEGALRNWRGLHFRRKPAVTRQLKLWTPDRLAGAVTRLQGAALTTRQTPALADAAASQALFALGSRARSAAAG
jgi:DNA polymerase-3 subunit delta